MATARTSHSCGHVTTAAGEDEIVVVGGYSGGGSLDSVEIFSISDMAWRSGMKKISTCGYFILEIFPSPQGNDFPVPIYGHAATNFGSSFIVGGGYGNGYYKTIYR